MVLDMTKPKNKQSALWPGMRGRDVARKSTPKVNILQEFTIDYPEIQFMVNHNSQSDGQNNSAKSGVNLRKKILHFNSLQRKGEDTKDIGILLWTKQAKMDLWSFDLITEPLSWWKIVHTTNQENQLKSFSIQVNKDECNKEKKFSPKITSPANRQDGSTGLTSSSWWYASEWIRKWVHNFFVLLRSLFVTVGFVNNWWRSTVTDGECGQNTFTARFPSHTCTLSSLCTHHIVAQGAARRACIQRVHPHVITCLSVCCFLVLSSSSVSRASTFSLTSTCSLFRTSTPTVSRKPSIKPKAHPPNEEYCSVAIYNPLTRKMVNHAWQGHIFVGGSQRYRRANRSLHSAQQLVSLRIAEFQQFSSGTAND